MMRDSKRQLLVSRRIIRIPIVGLRGPNLLKVDLNLISVLFRAPSVSNG